MHYLTHSRITATLLAYGAVLCLIGAAPATRPVLTKDVVGNRRVKLVSVRVSETAGQNLMAQFAQADDPKNEIVAAVRFPAHSHTTHETTLMNIVRASVDWSVPEDTHQWRNARIVPVFSIPADSQRVEQLELWWFQKFDAPAPAPAIAAEK